MQGPRTLVRPIVLAAALAAAGCTGSIGGPGYGPGGGGPTGPGGGGQPGGAGGGGGGPPPPDQRPLGGTEPLACDEAARQPGSPRIWRLTRAQYNHTVADLLADATDPASEFLPEVGKNGFLNDAYELRVRDADATLMRSAAKSLAGAVVKDRLAAVFPCDASKLADPACARQFVTGFGNRAFRRPLSEVEVSRYLALYAAAGAAQPALGPQAVIEAMLQSPKFLFRSELGEAAGAGGRARLTPHETASALSYLLSDTMPDAALMAAADGGKLGTPQEIEAQARRLLAQPRARPALVEFYRQLLEYEALPDAAKDAALFPEFDAVRADMARETELFVDDLLFAGDAKLGTLFTAQHTFMNASLAKIYGQSVAGSALVKSGTRPGERAGFLTHPGLMAVLSVADRTSPVGRGRFVRERLLCQPLSDPPQAVDTNIPPLPGGTTRRQQLAQKTSGAACQGCHGLINDIGFGFETLDAIGRHRTTENGLPLDAAGVLTETRDVDGPFRGPAELAARLAGSAQVRECFAVQTFRYAMGRRETRGDSCAVKAMYDRFASSGLDLKELVLSVVLSDSFLYRQK